jgi:AcrR family transcriptional regulator
MTIAAPHEGPLPAGQPPRWERRKERRPAELLEAALGLFVERGYAGTRLDDIAASAGVSKGTLYLYFANKEELFKARAKAEGRVKLIDIIRARLDAKNDCFLAELPSLRLTDVRISEQLVHEHERMLTGGFYAEVELTYDPTIAEEKNGKPLI